MGSAIVGHWDHARRHHCKLNMSLLEMIQQKVKVHRCKRCNRPLTDSESIKLGIGPICLSKEQRVRPYHYYDDKLRKLNMDKGNIEKVESWIEDDMLFTVITYEDGGYDEKRIYLEEIDSDQNWDYVPEGH